MDHIKPFYTRKSVRLQNFDYTSPNYYFVTLCTFQKKCIFATTKELSEWGEIAKKDMEKVPHYYSGVRIDHFVIMPNHIHMILILESGFENLPELSKVINGYKAGVSRKIRKGYTDISVWQRRYYEHIIRNQSDYETIWEYIENNPIRWEEDKFYIRDL